VGLDRGRGSFLPGLKPVDSVGVMRGLKPPPPSVLSRLAGVKSEIFVKGYRNAGPSASVLMTDMNKEPDICKKLYL